MDAFSRPLRGHNSGSSDVDREHAGRRIYENQMSYVSARQRVDVGLELAVMFDAGEGAVYKTPYSRPSHSIAWSSKS